MKTKIILLLLFIISFSACLKNGAYNTDFSNVGASVDLPLAASNNDSLATFTFASAPTVSFPVYINLASPNVLGTAVTATLAVDTAYLNYFNTANGTSFELLPDSVYMAVNGWKRTIPAGQRMDSMYVKIDVTKMDLSRQYAFPVTIQDASVPIEQWKHLIINPIVENKYDGQYDLFIETVGWGAYGVADGPPSLDYGKLGMVTTAATTNVFDTGYQPVFTGGSPNGFGATEPQFTFDPTTNKLVSVINLIPDDGRGRTFEIDSAVTTSRWDPATRNIYAAYLMFQIGRPTQYIYDTLIYQGPRP
jgi:hypothetical protein